MPDWRTIRISTYIAADHGRLRSGRMTSTASQRHEPRSLRQTILDELYF
jgi:hypothetical protein